MSDQWQRHLLSCLWTAKKWRTRNTAAKLFCIRNYITGFQVVGSSKFQLGSSNPSSSSSNLEEERFTLIGYRDPDMLPNRYLILEYENFEHCWWQLNSELIFFTVASQAVCTQGNVVTHRCKIQRYNSLIVMKFSTQIHPKSNIKYLFGISPSTLFWWCH